jgi:hypothetical protein
VDPSDAEHALLAPAVREEGDRAEQPARGEGRQEPGLAGRRVEQGDPGHGCACTDRNGTADRADEPGPHPPELVVRPLRR